MDEQRLAQWQVGDLIKYDNGTVTGLVVGFPGHKIVWVTNSGYHVECGHVAWEALKPTGLTFLGNSALSYNYTGAEQLCIDFDLGYFRSYFDLAT